MIQGSINSLPIVIAVIASFAVTVTAAGAVCWSRNRLAKQGKRQQSGIKKKQSEQELMKT